MSEAEFGMTKKNRLQKVVGIVVQVARMVVSQSKEIERRAFGGAERGKRGGLVF